MTAPFFEGRAMNFYSRKKYKKWLAYGHMHGEFEKTPGHQPVSIKGKPHKVEHDSGDESTSTEERISKWRNRKTKK